MSNEDRMMKYMNRNIRLFPTLCALTWDVIFVWVISTMFFTTQKGLTNSQVIMLDSILMLSGCILCVPVNRLFQNISPINSTRVGMLGYAVYLLLSIFGTHYFTFAVGTVFLAFGYVINGVKVNTILTDSLMVVKRDKDYQRVYGKGLGLYHVIEAVGAIVVTYIYSFNAYAAYYVSLGVVIFTILFTYLFKDVKKFQEKNVDINPVVTKKPRTRKPDGYLKILSSAFFLSLLFFMFMMRGTLAITGSGLKIYLQQLVDGDVIPIWLFGYLYAGYKLCNAISSKYQFKLDLKFGVRSLIIFVVLSFVTFIGIGLLYLYNWSSIFVIVLIIILSYVQGLLLHPCRIFVNNYMQVCMPKRNIDRAYSLRIMMEYLGYALISSLYALLLNVFGDNYGLTSIVYIAILSIPLFISLILFIRQLCKQYAKKHTIIKSEYTDS